MREVDFRNNLRRVLNRFDADRRSDALADAQSAFLSLQRDPEFRDHGAEGYTDYLRRAESGYRALADILEHGDA